MFELTKYIHLNPVRAGIVDGLSGLNKYLWPGHSALMGTVLREWQDQKTVLDYFGAEISKARKGYEGFVADGVSLGRRLELLGGGLVRSLGDWFQVVSMRRRSATISSDARILGGSDFVDRMLTEAKEKEKGTAMPRPTRHHQASDGSDV